MESADLDALAARLGRRLVAHEIYLDAPLLTGLGSGELYLELRHGLCRHGNRWVPPLLALNRLRDALKYERASADGGDLELQLAEVTSRIRLVPQQGARNSRMTWIGAGEEFIACTLEIEVRLATASASGGFRQTFGLEWPRQCRLWSLPPLPPPRASGPAALP
ncbi:MAG TPA: hypothetical protein VMJ30_09040 [Gemmatimonadales bacterium]|nr:hypothetical protein [Gemmatimonadales bacterium]